MMPTMTPARTPALDAPVPKLMPWYWVAPAALTPAMQVAASSGLLMALIILNAPGYHETMADSVTRTNGAYSHWIRMLIGDPACGSCC